MIQNVNFATLLQTQKLSDFSADAKYLQKELGNEQSHWTPRKTSNYFVKTILEGRRKISVRISWKLLCRWSCNVSRDVVTSENSPMILKCSKIVELFEIESEIFCEFNRGRCPYKISRENCMVSKKSRRNFLQNFEEIHPFSPTIRQGLISV